MSHIRRDIVSTPLLLADEIRLGASKAPILKASLANDPASIASGAKLLTQITVTGALVGDFVLASYSLSLGGLGISGYVSAADTVQVTLENNTGGAVDLAAGTFYAVVVPRSSFFSS